MRQMHNLLQELFRLLYKLERQLRRRPGTSTVGTQTDTPSPPATENGSVQILEPEIEIIQVDSDSDAENQ